MHTFLIHVYKYLAKYKHWLVGLGFFLCMPGLFYAFWGSPPDYQQGESVRLMYIHVPCSWLALMIYVGLGLGALYTLIWPSAFVTLFLKAGVPIGFFFTSFSLITGSIWGKPTWGTWWVWDARLTSMVVLLMLYAGYWMGLATAQNPKSQRLAHGIVVMGLVNLPIIKYSVTWWTTLHQGASFMGAKAASVDTVFWPPLLLMFLALVFLFLGLWCYGVESFILGSRIQALRVRFRDASKIGEMT